MKGLAINFIKGAAVLVPTGQVEDFDATVQNVAVNIVTTVGSDGIFPDRGTGLFKQALRGIIMNINEAHRVSTEARLDTLFFIRKHDPADEEIKLGICSLSPIEYERTFLKLTLGCTNLANTKTKGTIILT